jgi:hypothetical protein
MGRNEAKLTTVVSEIESDGAKPIMSPVILETNKPLPLL